LAGGAGETLVGAFPWQSKFAVAGAALGRAWPTAPLPVQIAGLSSECIVWPGNESGQRLVAKKTWHGLELNTLRHCEPHGRGGSGLQKLLCSKPLQACGLHRHARDSGRVQSSRPTRLPCRYPHVSRKCRCGRRILLGSSTSLDFRCRRKSVLGNATSAFQPHTVGKGAREK